MKKFRFRALYMLCVFGFLLTACPAKQRRAQPEASYKTSDQAVTIMTYNVENLFDHLDDRGKSDETYLPRSKKVTRQHRKKCRKIDNKKWQKQCLLWDWNAEVVDKKIEQIGQVIQAAKGGQGPDIVVLQEVENRRILEKLRKGPLKDLGYEPALLIEGKDERGIDVAILSRFKLMKRPQLHDIPFLGVNQQSQKDTRGILQATYALPNNKWLTVFAVHFPAPFHPTDMRVQSMLHLNKLRAELPEDRLVVAAGDFNIPKDEMQEFSFAEKFIDESWDVAHTIQCDDCEGTSYYPPKDMWSFLDMILLSKNFTDKTAKRGWHLVPESIRVFNQVKGQLDENGFPMSFDPETLAGFSDHLPLLLDILPNSVTEKVESTPQEKP